MESLKCDLKAFERDFLIQYGRKPSKEDIKSRPDIALKYKQYNSKKTSQVLTDNSKSALEVKNPFEVSSTAAAPITAATAAISTTTALQPPSLFATPKKQSPAHPSKSKTEKDIAYPRHDAVPPPASPSKFTTGSPANKGKSANPFARDTPRSNARKWLSGLVATPDRKLPQSWRNTQALQRDDTTMTDVSAAASTSLPLNLMVPLEQQKAWRESSAEPRNANGLVPSTSKVPIFDPTRSKRSVSSSAAFEDDRKASTSKDSDGQADQPSKAKKPRLAQSNGKHSNFYKNNKNKVKGKQKADSAKMDAEGVATAANEDGDESTEDLEANRPPTERLEDGSVVLAMPQDDGTFLPVHVRHYKPYAHLKPPSNWEEQAIDDMQVNSPVARNDIQQQQQDNSMDVDVQLPAHLTSLLSLTSPNKKHRQAIASTKERLVKTVLQEPSLKLAAPAGLEELNDDDEVERYGSDMDALDDEEADDDWASEPEGWKELGGDDLTGLEERL